MKFPLKETDDLPEAIEARFKEVFWGDPDSLLHKIALKEGPENVKRMIGDFIGREYKGLLKRP